MRRFLLFFACYLIANMAHAGLVAPEEDEVGSQLHAASVCNVESVESGLELATQGELAYQNSYYEPMNFETALHKLHHNYCGLVKHSGEVGSSKVVMLRLKNITYGQQKYLLDFSLKPQSWGPDFARKETRTLFTKRPTFEIRGHPSFVVKTPFLYLGHHATVKRFALSSGQYGDDNGINTFIWMETGSAIRDSHIRYNFWFGDTPPRSAIDIVPFFYTPGEQVLIEGVYIDISALDANITSAINIPLDHHITKDSFGTHHKGIARIHRLLLKFNPRLLPTPISFTRKGKTAASNVDAIVNPRLETNPDDPTSIILRGRLPKGAVRLEAFRPIDYDQHILTQTNANTLFDWNELRSQGLFVEHEAEHNGAVEEEFKLHVPAYTESELSADELAICKTYGTCHFGRGYMITAFDKDGRPSAMLQTDSDPDDKGGDYYSIYAGGLGQHVEEMKAPCPEGMIYDNGSCTIPYDALAQLYQSTTGAVAGITHVLASLNLDQDTPDGPAEDDSEAPNEDAPGPTTEACPMGAITINDQCICDVDKHWVEIGNKNGNPICGCPEGKIIGGQCVVDAPDTSKTTETTTTASSTETAPPATEQCAENEVEHSSGSCYCSSALGFTRNPGTNACECNGTITAEGRCVADSALPPSNPLDTSCATKGYTNLLACADNTTVSEYPSCPDGQVYKVATGECVVVPSIVEPVSGGGCSLIVQ